MTLFVDVDDTLILWPKLGESKTLISGDSAAPNPAVIRFVERWAQFHPEEMIVVWSLGGGRYAETMTHKHAPEMVRLVRGFWDKAPTPVIAGDLFLDDDPLPFYRLATIHPDMLG